MRISDWSSDVCSSDLSLIAFTCSSSSSSMRATGMPDWMVRMTVSTAPARESKEHTAASLASGMPSSLRCTSSDEPPSSLQSLLPLSYPFFFLKTPPPTPPYPPTSHHHPHPSHHSTHPRHHTIRSS